MTKKECELMLAIGQSVFYVLAWIHHQERERLQIGRKKLCLSPEDFSFMNEIRTRLVAAIDAIEADHGAEEAIC